MCGPALAAVAAFVATNAPAIMTATTVAATAVSTAGVIQQGKTASAAAKYQGQIADVNAVNADRAAREALERGELDALEHGRKVAALRGRQTVSTAAQGIELGFGSPLDVAQDTDLLAAEDTRNIYENANREAEGYRINASNYRADAAGSRAQAANARTQMVIDAGSTVLSGATQLGGVWKKYGRPKWGN